MSWIREQTTDKKFFCIMIFLSNSTRLKPMMNNNNGAISRFDPQGGQTQKISENSRHIIAPADLSRTMPWT